MSCCSLTRPNAAAFEPLHEYEPSVQNDMAAKDFKPPGKLVRSYKSQGRDFEIWCGSLADPAVKNIVNNMQIFISFFIEGGQFINLKEEAWTMERWSVFFVSVIRTSYCPTFILTWLCPDMKSFPSPQSRLWHPNTALLDIARLTASGHTLPRPQRAL